MPLPASNNDDLTHGPTIAHAIEYTLTIKAAGSRSKKACKTAPEVTQAKGKGKQKQADTDDDNSTQSEDSDAPPKKQGGPCHEDCHTGAGNYQEQDLKEVLHLVEKELPLGQRGWKWIHQKYVIWATEKGQPV